MANKAAAQAFIDAIATGQLNTAAEVRSMGGALLSQLFPAPVRESTSLTRTITTSGSGTNGTLAYALIFTKSGNTVSVVGQIQNTGSSAYQAGTTLINITDTEYQGRSLMTFNAKENNIAVEFITGSIKALTSFPGLTTIRINATYITND